MIFGRPIEAERVSHFDLVKKWREALLHQLLTPAPLLEALKWKRAQLAGDDIHYVTKDTKRIERAIADDEAFLRAHPMRRAKGGT